MRGKPPELPAYIRMPDGLRLTGSAQVNDRGRLMFQTKQMMKALPRAGLPVQLTIAGIAEDEEAQIGIEGRIRSARGRVIEVLPDGELPDDLIKVMEPDSMLWLAFCKDAAGPLGDMRRQGMGSLCRSMRGFLIELGDRLSELSASSHRSDQSDQDVYYDALSALNQSDEGLLKNFAAALRNSLQKTEQSTAAQSAADGEGTAARKLDLVTMDEMDRKLAVDKIVDARIERHQVELECLTIRAAVLADRDPRQTRAPFHPADIVQAFADAFTSVSENIAALQEALRFFRDHYMPLLDTLYRELNEIFIKAGIEPDLEDEIQTQGSRLNRAEKSIVKSVSRTRRETDRGASTEAQSAQPRYQHEAMYDAVMSALNTTRDMLHPAQTGAESAADGAAHSEGRAGGAAAEQVTIPAAQLLDVLQALQAQQPAQAPTTSLAELPPLETLVREQAAPGVPATLGRKGANRLDLVDNVFRTLHNNFEVSTDMVSSLAKLRVPLARLSLQEPRFFTEPGHPARQVLDKLSFLASADHTVSRALQNKVAALIDRLATNYAADSSVFAEAQGELDALISQQDRIVKRSIGHVISGLEGQERLSRAQRRVEQLLETQLSGDSVPTAVMDLLDQGGWRSALVQLALRESEDSAAWREESELLKSLLDNLNKSARGELEAGERRDMQYRLKALNDRLQQSNPGSVAHESALNRLHAVLSAKAPLASTAYASRVRSGAPGKERVERLPRLRRWLQRAQALEPGVRLRCPGKDGEQQRMRLAWISEDRDRFAFVNERGQKVAELSAVQMARQLSRGARAPTPVDTMSVLDQSMYETLEGAQKTLSFERNRDSLTQLINGESLLYQLQRSLSHARSRSSEHAFLMLNIDNFALVNEVFDETSGDEVLGEFAQLLGQLNEHRALTARIQGDEFGILLTHYNVEEARKLADKIRRDIADSSIHIGQEAVSFTVSIGITAVNRASGSAESVLEQARGAVKIAKDQGRDRIVVFDVDRQEAHDYRSAREESQRQFEEALSANRLVLRAQPITQSAADGSEDESQGLHHYEILLSLKDDDGKPQSPLDFIRSAERFGYVTLVDRWVVRETFAWISRLMDMQKEAPQISINLSGTSITDNDFLDYTLEQISEYGVGTSKLCFEITETGVIDNLPRAADFVRTLKNIGCKFSLDDFGTGVSSYEYLKELPLDYVKIDGMFITNIGDNPTDFAMAKSINDLAHFLGQKTVAECVENLDTLPALREIGIDYLQGWGIAPPRELGEIIGELADIET